MNAEELICKLKEKEKTVSFMESCTGGMLCSEVSNVEHCSSAFVGGYVTYSNEQKIRCGVPKEIIDKYGVYSKECAESMSVTCRNNTQSDIAVGVTGTLGNIDTKNKDSKIGDIYICVSDNTGKKKSEHITLDDSILECSRKTQKKVVMYKAFNLIGDFLEDNK